MKTTEELIDIPAENLHLRLTDCLDREDKEDVLLDSVLEYRKGLVLTANEQEAEAVREFLDKYEVGQEVVIEPFGSSPRDDDEEFEFLVHWNLPPSLADYCRDLARVGLKGGCVFCEMLVSVDDVNAILNECASCETESRELADRRSLLNWTSEPGCRRTSLLNYLGIWTPLVNCGHCDRCLEEESTYEQVL